MAHPGLWLVTPLRPRILSVGLRRPLSILVIVCPANLGRGLGILGFCDSLSDVWFLEVQDTQGAILHPCDRFDAVEGLAVRAANSAKPRSLGSASARWWPWGSTMEAFMFSLSPWKKRKSGHIRHQ